MSPALLNSRITSGRSSEPNPNTVTQVLSMASKASVARVNSCPAATPGVVRAAAATP